jgi:hypothetical protein
VLSGYNGVRTGWAECYCEHTGFVKSLNDCCYQKKGHVSWRQLQHWFHRLIESLFCLTYWHPSSVCVCVCVCGALTGCGLYKWADRKWDAIRQINQCPCIMNCDSHHGVWGQGFEIKYLYILYQFTHFYLNLCDHFHRMLLNFSPECANFFPTAVTCTLHFNFFLLSPPILRLMSSHVCVLFKLLHLLYFSLV